MLKASPPFRKGELPTLLLEHLPQPVDYLTLLPRGGDSRPLTPDLRSGRKDGTERRLRVLPHERGQRVDHLESIGAS